MPTDLNKFRLRNILPPSMKQDPEEDTLIRPELFSEGLPALGALQGREVPLPTLTSPTPTDVASKESTVTKTTSMMDRPETETQKRLRALLEAAPLPGQFKPSRGRKILAGITGGLVGAGYGPEIGAKLTSEIADAPFRRSMEDWQGQVGPLLKQDEIERLREKDKTESLSGIASFLRAQAETNPEFLAEKARLTTEAEERAKEPGREAARKAEKENLGLREEGLDRRTELAQSGQDYRALLADARAREDEKGRNARAAADRASREKIAANTARLRKELAEASAADKKKYARIPIDQQIKAREDAEYRVLRELGKDELDAIADPITNTRGEVVGYTLKPQGKIKDPRWAAKWEVRKDDAARMAQQMLDESFDPTGNQEEIDNNLGPWEEF